MRPDRVDTSYWVLPAENHRRHGETQPAQAARGHSRSRINHEKRKETPPIARENPRVSRHNGRSGKHGVYNPKHNDRSFNVENADNITPSRTSLNLYWDCQNGLRTHEENASGQYPTFTQHEHDEYERRYGAFIAGQNARNRKSGHAKRNRTVDDLLADARICPEETIYQIGKEGDCPPPEVLTEIVQEFMNTIEERFGKHVHVLDWALHLDETSPHIHARQVFDVENRYGEREPKQEKALEALGIPLPQPDKKPSRFNNRKITFDSMCRSLLLDICRYHGLQIEEIPLYGGKANREKNDYIISAQCERIAQQDTLIAEQEQQLSATERELAQKTERLTDVDKLLADVSDAAYQQAVRVVTETVVRETQKADRSEITQLMKNANAPGAKLREKERNLLLQWLSDARTAIKESTTAVFARVADALRKPEVSQTAKETIREQTRPSVLSALRRFSPDVQHEKKRHLYDDRDGR